MEQNKKEPDGYRYPITEGSTQETLMKAFNDIEDARETGVSSEKVVPQQAFVFNKDLKTEDEKEYLLLLVIDAEKEEDQELVWEKVTGRTNAYDRLRTLIEAIDLDQSLILTEDTTLKKAKSAYVFMRYCIDCMLVKEDESSFHLDDYTDDPVSFVTENTPASK